MYCSMCHLLCRVSVEVCDFVVVLGALLGSGRVDAGPPCLTKRRACGVLVRLPIRRFVVSVVTAYAVD